MYFLKQTMVATLFYIAFIESRRARRNTGKHKHTKFPHVFVHVRDTLSWAYGWATIIAKCKSDFTRLSVCLSTILDFHNKWFLLLDNHYIRFLNIIMFQDLTVAEIKW